MDEMENPAQQLLTVLREWRATPPNVSVLEHRCGDVGEGDPWWVEHARVTGLLAEVAAHVEGNPNAEYFRTHVIDRLFRAVFATDVPMENMSTSRRTHVNEADLGALALVAGSWSPGMVVDLAALVGLQSVSAETRELLTSASLDEKTRKYLFALVSHLDQAISRVAVFGSVDVSEHASRLIAALTVEFSDSPEEEREEASGIVQKIGRILKKFPFSHVAGQLAIEVGKAAIGELPRGAS